MHNSKFVNICTFHCPNIIRSISSCRKIQCPIICAYLFYFHMQSMEKQSSPMIIVAMKGHPGTGKTTLARAISASLKLPLLDKDDIKDHTTHLQTHHNLPSSSLNELSYSVLFQITRTQLSLGLSLVLDSPLSRCTLLDSLVQMSKEYGAHVVVVECKPRDEEEWRRRLEERGRVTNGVSSHKPSTWQEMERLLDKYDGCWDYDVGDFVSKIVVDTTAKEHDASDIVNMVIEFIKSKVGVPIM